METKSFRIYGKLFGVDVYYEMAHMRITSDGRLFGPDDDGPEVDIIKFFREHPDGTVDGIKY